VEVADSSETVWRPVGVGKDLAPARVWNWKIVRPNKRSGLNTQEECSNVLRDQHVEVCSIYKFSELPFKETLPLRSAPSPIPLHRYVQLFDPVEASNGMTLRKYLA